MLQIRLDKLLALVNALLIKSFQMDMSHHHSLHLDVSEDIQEFTWGLEKLATTCDGLELRMTGIAVRRMADKMKAATPPSSVTGDVQAWMAVILTRLQDEVSQKTYLYMPSKSMELIEERHHFGELVSDKFPNAIYDIDEAAKCLVFWRSTACVFHCMRTVDQGIKSLIGDSFNDQAYLDKHERRVWLEMIRRIRREAQKLDDVIASRWKGRQARLNEIAERLSLVADAHRNPTMHAEAKYTLEEAEDIFNTTKSFMHRLASGLHQDEVNDTEEIQNTENATGKENPDPQTQGRDGRSAQGSEAGEGFTARSQPEEEVGRTSTSHHSGDCTAKHTRLDRTEDA